MDGNHFEKWFEIVMPKLKPLSTISMGNAPYHLEKKVKFPTSSWKKSDIQEKFFEKKVTWNQDLIKRELLKKANEIKHLCYSCRVEEIAEKFGYKILRLSPYHCELISIEMIWSQVKGYVARENKT
ncbi:DDE_3 domain-containing protein [Trichonephila clavipes]|nr:DDE_3 domain-containing protein [Trichonephila clavipes]